MGNRHAMWLMWLGALVSLGVWGSPPASAATRDYVMDGVVRDFVTAAPLSGATVSSLATGELVTTDGEGRYEITGGTDEEVEVFAAAAAGHEDVRLTCWLDDSNPAVEAARLTQDWYLLPEGAEQPPHFWRGVPHDYPITSAWSLAFAPDGALYALVSLDPGRGSRYSDLVVRRYSPEGELLAEWGESGYGPGQFRDALDIAVADDGSVLVVDQANRRVQRLSAEGVYMGEISAPPGHLPTQVSVDGVTAYVAYYDEAEGTDEVWHYGLDGSVLGSWKTPVVPRSGEPAVMVSVTPQDMAVAPDSTLYLLSAGDGIDRVWHVSADGEVMDHWGDPAEVQSSYFAVGPTGNLYLSGGTCFGDVHTITLYTPAGAAVVVSGGLGRGPAELTVPGAIAVDSEGSAYVGDVYNGGIHVFAADGSFIRRWGSGGEGPGEFGTALDGVLMGERFDVAAAPDGSVYVADTGNRRVQHLSATGQFLGQWPFEGESGEGPYAVAVAPDATVYVADLFGAVERFDASGAPLGGFASPGDSYLIPGVDMAVLATGTLAMTVGSEEVFLLSSLGEVQATLEVPGLAYRVACTPSGDILVGRAGLEGRHAYVDRYDAAGDLVGSLTIADEWTCHLADISPAPDGTVYVMLWTGDGPTLVQLDQAWNVLMTVELDKLGPAARLEGWPTLSVAPTGLIWISDHLDHRVLALSYGEFADVAPWHWAYEAVEAAAAAGIVHGYEDGTYRPHIIVSRDQMAVFIARALAGGDAYVPTGPETPHFPDVGTDHWAYKHIEYCFAQNIVEGLPSGYYRPTWSVDRAQMAVYIARSIVDPRGEAGLEGYVPPTTPDFPDVDTDHWAYKHIEYCFSEGIVQGLPSGYYRPSWFVDRAQMAVYVTRGFGLPM